MRFFGTVHHCCGEAIVGRPHRPVGLRSSPKNCRRMLSVEMRSSVLRPLRERFGVGTGCAWKLLRERVPAYDQDRWLAPDIASAVSLLKGPVLIQHRFPDLH